MDRGSPPHFRIPFDHALVTPIEAPKAEDDSSFMSRSQISALRSPSHARHQSVPSFTSPHARDRSLSRGLAKLTLVERLSREPAPSSTLDDDCCSPKSASPARSPRPSHTPRRSRMSLTIPPTKSATEPGATNCQISSPLRSAQLSSSPTRDAPNAPLSDMNIPILPAHERARTSSLATLEEVAALDDADETFLTLVAFQERRVVELREELARAESELELLKQQWARKQLKFTRSARQEHVRQNSLTKLEQQINAGSTPATPRTAKDEMSSLQILEVGKRLAEGAKEGFLSVVEDFKLVVTAENGNNTPKRGRSPMHSPRKDIKLENINKKDESQHWHPKQPSPIRRTVSRSSTESDRTSDTLSRTMRFKIP
jgi:hypothetical protein